MNKTKRLSAIKKLITRFAIEDQEQLVALLAQEYGITTTQSLISRDLRQLGTSKTVRNGKACYETPASDTTYEILKRSVIDVDHNESMIVVHTLPGLADFIGDYLDEQESEHLLGTLAGENIVLVIPQSIKKIASIYTHACQLLHFKKL